MSWRPAVLLLAIVAAYWPALLGDYVYDDIELVVRNPALRNGDLAALLAQPLFGAGPGYWRPLTTGLLWLGDAAGGPAGVHTLALLLHAAATLLAYDVARRVFRAEAPAFWAALLFALHPVQAESVAWCAAINDPLWGVCALAAVQSALRWRDRDGTGRRRAPWATGAWLLAALLAKENAIAALPLVLAAVAWVPVAAGDRTAAPAVRATLVPLVAAVFAWWLLRAAVFGEATAGLLRAPGAPGPDLLRLASAPTELLVRHVALLVAPHPLLPFRALPDPAHLLQTLLAAALVAGAGIGLWRAFRGLSPAVRLGLPFVVLPLLPTLLLWRSLGSFPIADRYLYLAVFGLCLAVVPRSAAGLRSAALGAAAAGLGALAFAQTWVWHDQASLVAHGLRHAPAEPTLHVMAGDLALARAQQGEAAALADARHHYDTAERAAAAATTPARTHRALAPARLGLAWCLMLEQQARPGARPAALVGSFQRAVDTDPANAAAWVGLGVAHGIAEQPADAERAFRRALELAPDHAEAWFNLGFLQVRQGRPQQARHSLQQALRCNPDNVRARQLLDQLR